jgi:hypothetical protein
MRTSVRLGLAGLLVILSAGVPCALQHRARLELRARREALRQQAGRLSLLAEQNGRLSNLVARAKTAPPLTGEQLRELLRLRNEKRRLAERTNPAAGLGDEDSLEAEDTARDRAHLVELAAAVGISAQDASRFFDQLRQEEKALEETWKGLSGSEAEKQSQMRAIAQEELSKLATQALGQKGPALVRKMAEGK